MKKFSAAAARIFAAGLLIAIASPAASQQAYPTKPIRFIVPYPPGGATDPMARMAAQKLAEKWDQPVIIDNRPGGNSIIGTEAVAKAPPDGYTILLVSSAFLTGPSLLPVPYDPIKDFDAVATIAKYRHVLVLNPSVSANIIQTIIGVLAYSPGGARWLKARSCTISIR